MQGSASFIECPHNLCTIGNHAMQMLKKRLYQQKLFLGAIQSRSPTLCKWRLSFGSQVMLCFKQRL